MAGWLSPYRVIDLTDETGLLAGQMLAKLGADVIQVEPPGGSSARRLAPLDGAGRSFFWSAFAAGKRGVVLDLHTAQDLEALHGLLAGADVLLELAPPGAMAALGLARESLAERHPHLVQVSVTPFGSAGPKRGWAASDLTLWAAGGVLLPNRDAEGPPLRISVPQAWLHAAADAAAAAMIALIARQRTGRGQHADISTQEAVTPTTLSCITAEAVGHQGFALFPRPLPGPVEADGSPRLRGPKWRARDGLVELMMGAGPFGQRTNLLFAWLAEEGELDETLARIDWTTMPLRPAPDDPAMPVIEAARDAIAAFIAPRAKAGIAREAVARGLLMAPVNTMADLLASEHLAARDFFVTVEEDGRPITLPGRFAHGPDGMFGPFRGAPALGEHTEAILRPAAGARTAPPPPPALVRAPGDAAGPLAGLKVADLAWVVAGPAIGRALADFGATVVRVESSTRVETARLMGPYPGGQIDPQRCALYDTYNAGKLGLALDLTRGEGQQVARDLTAWADVLVESFVPGQMARWGLAPERLRAANPRLIGLSTSLMGQSGPFATLGGYGNIGAAMAGFQSIVGREGATPIGPFGPYTDYIGPRFGLLALLAALDHRSRTGEGCWLDISQAEAGIQFLGPQIADAAATGRIAAPMGNRDPNFSPHGVFPCAGADRWVAIVARSDAEWSRLAGLVGGAAADRAFATLAGRRAAEDRLEALLAAWTRTRDAAEVETALQAIAVPVHRAADSADMVADPQLIARGHFVRLPHPLGGESVIEASRFALSDTAPRYRLAAPHFGRDNRQVLADILGYDDDRIASLEAIGVLR